MKYHFEFCIANATSEIKLTFPTSPMYIEGDTYNGRCKMWLKYAALPQNDAAALLAVIGNTNIGIEFHTPALNRFTLDISGGVAAQKFKNNQQSIAKFCLPLNNETIVYDDFDLQYTFSGAILDTQGHAGAALAAYPFYQSVETDPAGTIFIRNKMDLLQRTNAAGATGGGVDTGVDAEVPFFSLAPTLTPPANNALGTIIERGGANGTTAQNLYPNTHWLDGRNNIFGNLDKRVTMKLAATRPSDGNARGVAYCYENKNMNDSNCMIIGSPWGNTLTARTFQKSMLLNMADNDGNLPMIGTGRFEIVLEPMTNDDPVEVGI